MRILSLKLNILLSRYGGGQDAVASRVASAPRRDRQGYAAFRLHDRECADVGVHGCRRRRVPARPHADARRGDADAIPACRYRRDDLCIAQPIRRQRHQAVRLERLQALR